LDAEAKAKLNKEKPIPFDVVERELDAIKNMRTTTSRKKR
jgi:hypothetical protein